MPNGLTLATVERPWLNNQVRISCIPIGEYRCEPSYYHRGGYKAVAVTQVPGRTQIKFHIGNWPRNSQGCILVNSEHVYNSNGMYGIDSKRAFDIFMGYYGDKPFHLSIVNYAGGVL